MSDVRTAALARVSPAVTGLALGALALGPGLGRGFLLSYDMVFVPRLPLTAAALGMASGAPRAVPSDAVVAVFSHILPADLVQKIVLLSVFTLACSGAAALLRGFPLPARLAAGVFYTWNPYVGERLILGQWALLLGYAGLPWVVGAIAAGLGGWRGVARMCLALVPAAIGGFSAMCVSGLTAVPAASSVTRPGPVTPGRPGAHRRDGAAGARRGQPALAGSRARPPYPYVGRGGRRVRGTRGYTIRVIRQPGAARGHLERADRARGLWRPRGGAVADPGPGGHRRLPCPLPPESTLARARHRGTGRACRREHRCHRGRAAGAERPHRDLARFRRAPRRPAIRGATRAGRSHRNRRHGRVGRQRAAAVRTVLSRGGCTPPGIPPAPMVAAFAAAVQDLCWPRGGDPPGIPPAPSGCRIRGSR